MALTDTIFEAGTISGRTIQITGKPLDGASAAGYGAWINSITGSYPQVIKTPDGRARIIHTQQQVQKMQRWIDQMAYKSVRPDGTKPSLSVDFGPIIKPVALKYATIFAAGAFLAGWFGRGFLK